MLPDRGGWWSAVPWAGVWELGAGIPAAGGSGGGRRGCFLTACSGTGEREASP